MKCFKHLALLSGLLLAVANLSAQAPKTWAATDIFQEIQKLNFLGSALYVAAHPDDENQRLIAYLANGTKAETAYLSLTRGDGGQNLIGPEIRELLGVIRTQELLAARRIDGGQQFFTRANDFGYSKHPDETFVIWDREEVLGDVVWAIRKWQPDVIVNRFSEERTRMTHGHHTGSAMLAYDAFDLAADPKAYPEQLAYAQAWQPRRLFFNTSWWFYGSQEAFDKADKSEMMSVDIGQYYPLLGKSNNEIAAEARSMHKCQGFGATLQRGSQQDYLRLLKGDMPPQKQDLFEGINTTWSRVKGGEAVGELLAKAEAEFDFTQPSKVLPLLLQAYKSMDQVEAGYWRRVKTAALEEVILACLGLYAEVAADDYSATPGQQIELSLEVVNRSAVPVELETVTYLPMGLDTSLALSLEGNQEYVFYKKLELPRSLSYTNPYWLNETGSLGLYKVEDQELRGLPETPREFKARFQFVIDGVPMAVEREVVYKKTDPARGELYRPFELTPPVFANIAERVYIFTDEAPQPVSVRLRAGRDSISGSLRLALPDGWRTEPSSHAFELARKSEEQVFAFQLFPPRGQSEVALRAVAQLSDGSLHDKAMHLIEYDHIPTQTVLLDNQAKAVKIGLQRAGQRIGYLMGAGDEIPNSLEQIGYEVSLLQDRDISLEHLQQFDAVVVGIRAYNTNERMSFHQPILLEYVKRGGTMIVQYNTTGSSLKIDMEAIGPYPLKLSRDRVAVEEAEVRILAPKHQALNWPNKITAADFEGWVQERGLYFPSEWDEAYTALLSSNDPGEDAKDGGLLIAPYGKGHYVYSGYSWFRQLPAGVPGAYRLFANLLSIGKMESGE